MFEQSATLLRTCRFFRTFLVLLSAVILFLPAANEAAAATPLQPVVDHAQPGEVIRLPAGEYTGPVRINKPLRMYGEETVLTSQTGSQPLLVIEADDVVLDGLRLTDNRQTPAEPAVAVFGNRNKLLNLTVRTQTSGIELRQAHHNHLKNIRIDGTGKNGGNGIDLWGSHDNLIESAAISNVKDGIYVERSESNEIRNNLVSRSRYGFHLMFAKDTRLVGNSGQANVTGAMIMGTEATDVMDNTFFKQSENVNDQGVLVYDATHTRIVRNRMEGNRVGLYVEQSRETDVRSNLLARNFIGLQVVNTEQNRFSGNAFVANVVQAQAVHSRNDQFEGNYWDDANGIDLTDDGYSDLPHRINPFFSFLTKGTPSFQLFFHSPGTVFLETMYAPEADQWLTDHSPLMQPFPDVLPEPERGADQRMLLVAGLLLLSISVMSIYYWGVKQK